MIEKIQELLGDKADYLLNFNNPKIPKDMITTPSPDFVDNIFLNSDRNNRVIGNLQWIYNHGRLAGSGYVSILPVDQGIPFQTRLSGRHPGINHHRCNDVLCLRQTC